MRKYLYVACDGGQLSTLAGSGGILEIQLDPKPDPGAGDAKDGIRFEEFNDGRGGSPHFLKQSPNGKHLVMSCANAPQIYVFPLRKDGRGYDLKNPRIINNFCNLGIPSFGPDCTADFFDFWGHTRSSEDSDFILTHFNRLLVKVDLVTEKMKVLHDFSYFGPKNWESGRPRVKNPIAPAFFHQITVKGRYIVIDDALRKCIYVLKKTGPDSVDLLYETGDGYTSGHHCAFTDPETGQLVIARPSFNFASADSSFQIKDNVLSLYYIHEKEELRKVKTFQYAHYLENHAPVDSFVENGFFYAAYGVPGSVLKIDIRTGKIDKRTGILRPWFLKRLFYSVVDYVVWHLIHGTSYKGYDNGKLDFHQHFLAFTIGLTAGTRGGFFTLASDQDDNVLYSCHRGFNKLYILDKATLEVIRTIRLPRRTDGKKELFTIPFLYPISKYLSRGIGAHHGMLATLPTGPKP